jgi:hypothetical protein
VRHILGVEASDAPGADFPAIRFCQKVATSLPIGVSAPMPVMNTRVICSLLAFAVWILFLLAP